MFVAAVVCGTGHVVVALVVLSVVAFVVGSVSTLLAALAVSGIGWLFLIGFVVAGQGVLRFHGESDGIRLLVLAGAGSGGRLVAIVTSAARRRRRARADMPYPEALPAVPMPR
jgi:hypothetical protein